MQRRKALRVAVMAAICAAAAAGTAAASPQALSPWDAQRYAAAFEAADRGDFIESQMQVAEIQDQTLAGHLAFHQLMHPTAHKASFGELAAWLERFSDLPGADRIFALAAKRDPSAAKALKAPTLAGVDWSRIEGAARGLFGRASADKGRSAREAFYSGDVKRAYDLAQSSGERWIAGMAAYRLAQYDKAEGYLLQVARDENEDPWLRAAGGYWASRAAAQRGDAAAQQQFLRLAARQPFTFYGMIAERQVGIQTAQAPAAAETGTYTPAAFTGDAVALNRFINAEPRARRAVALAQIGQATEAGLELRAGLALAKTAEERDQWMQLVLALNAPLTTAADAAPLKASVVAQAPDYPVPDLQPKWGFTVDKALVYAIVRQESRFNPEARSPAGAVGLMQLMPEAAARAAGDDKLKSDMSPLLDPSFNLRVGQDYLTWLMERGVGYDILRTVAAYNGGPGTLLKTAQQVGDDDSLLLIECLPSQETRNYVEKVMAGYWAYRRKFGQESATLDAVARGAKFIDARLDR